MNFCKEINMTNTMYIALNFDISKASKQIYLKWKFYDEKEAELQRWRVYIIVKSTKIRIRQCLSDTEDCWKFIEACKSLKIGVQMYTVFDAHVYLNFLSQMLTNYLW